MWKKLSFLGWLLKRRKLEKKKKNLRKIEMNHNPKRRVCYHLEWPVNDTQFIYYYNFRFDQMLNYHSEVMLHIQDILFRR